MPRPFGIFYKENRPCYEDVLQHQIDSALQSESNMDDLISGNEYWKIN